MSTFTSEERATIIEWVNSFVVMPPNEENFNENLVRYEIYVRDLVIEVEQTIIETIEMFSSNNLPQDKKLSLNYTDFRKVVLFILDLERPISVYSLTIYEVVLLAKLNSNNAFAKHYFNIHVPDSINALYLELIKDSDLNASA
ncbi:hypothetical protein [Vibrio olivae]|uniref:Uncharacterized protein n=1 Tax=Vibrio olivae TaxID=1243002 RepID=A0ABV5HQ47_9VIBR